VLSISPEFDIRITAPIPLFQQNRSVRPAGWRSARDTGARLAITHCAMK